MRKRFGESGRTAMRRRPHRPRLMSKTVRPPFDLPGKVDHLVCYLSGGERNPNGRSGVIAGPLRHWVVDRDYELCRRINEQIGFGVHCRPYEVTSAWNMDEGRGVPTKWIGRIYKHAREKRYKRLHLVGFSGGGAVASSQLVRYPNDMVQSLVVISGPVAEGIHMPHVNAAYDADSIKARTLLIYGKKDVFRRAIEIWKKNARPEILEYEGEHDFGKKGEPSFELVARKVVDWLKRSTDQGVRPLRLRRRRRRRRTKTRAKAR